MTFVGTRSANTRAITAADACEDLEGFAHECQTNKPVSPFTSSTTIHVHPSPSFLFR